MERRLAFLHERLEQAGLLGPPWRSDVAVILWLSTFLLTFNIYLLATVLPAAVRNLHTSVSGVESALILFPLLSGLLVPAGRRLVEGYGRRRAIEWALLAYGSGQLLAAASSSVAALIAGYALLGGVAGALLLAAAWSLIDESPSRQTRGIGITLFAAAPMAGSFVGPLIGGLASGATTWRLGFIAELALVAVLSWRTRRLPRTASPTSAAIRWTNALVVPVGAAAVVVGVGLGDEYGWWRATRSLDVGSLHVAPFGLSVVPLLIAAGVAVLSWSIARGARVGLLLYRRPRFVAAVLIGLSLGTAATGIFYALRLYLSMGPRLDGLLVGLALAPFGLGALLVTAAVLLTKPAAGPRVTVAAGLVISAVGIGLVQIGIAAWGGGLGSAPGLFVLGVGNGIATSRLTNLILSTVAADHESEAHAISVSAGDLAYGLGIAILGVVFVGVAAHAIVTGIERQLIERSLVLPPEVRQQVEARLENDLRTLTPAEQDAVLQSQPARVRAAIQTVAAGAFKQGVNVALESALGGVGLAFALLVVSGIPSTVRRSP